MTDIEAYAFIEQQYIDAFGEHFLLANQLSMISSQTQYATISGSFYRALEEHFGIKGVNGGSIIIHTINRERLFGDASLDEVHDIIRAKFPETLTHRDMLLMHYEMRSVGLFDIDDSWVLAPGRKGYGIGGLSGTISGLAHGHPSIPWEKMLHMPVNLSYLFGAFNIWQWQGEYDASPALLQFMTRTLGGQFDDRGWLIGGVMPWDWFGGIFKFGFDDDEALIHDALSGFESPDLIWQFLEMLEEREQLNRIRNIGQGVM
jgi:hypothetical protein